MNQKHHHVIRNLGLGLIFYSSLFIIGVGILFYSVTPWPSPKPYSDENIEQNQGAIGSWGHARTQTYATDKPLADIMIYYKESMGNYCFDDPRIEELGLAEHYTPSNRWRLEKLPQYIEEDACVMLECGINRWFLAQGFEVLLCEETSSRTVVVQIDMWED